MRFRLDYVPATFDSAVKETLNVLTHEERVLLCSVNDPQLTALHFSLGASIRTAWSLWDESSPLVLDCKRLRLPSHADDLALAILEAARAELCGA